MGRRQPDSRVRRLRWHGDPAEDEQPDAGDVIAEDLCSRILLVRDARELTSGPNAGKPCELALLVVDGHVGHLQEPLLAGGRVFEAHRCRRGCPCGQR